MNDRPDPDFTIEPGAVVVGVDGTGAALRAVTWAAAEARLRGLELHVLHAAPYATDVAGRRRASAILGHARTTAHQRVPGMTVRPVMSRLAPLPALVAAAQPAGLLVLGMITGGSPAEPILGSVTPAVSSRARCPVVIVRGTVPTSRRPAPVVVGVSSVEDDAEALAAAFADAARHGSGLIVVHAEHGAHDRVDALAREALARSLAPWREAYPQVDVQHRISDGSPVDALLAAARDARLVVLGPHRRSAPARVLFGSTSRGLLHLSRTPVEIVHAGGPQDAPATSTSGAAR